MIQDYQEYLEMNQHFLLCEGEKFDKFKNVIAKTIKELKLNFKFLVTFGPAISLFYPIVERLLKNEGLSLELTPMNIILATICGVSIAIDNNKDNIKHVMDILKDETWIVVIKKISKFILNIRKLFSYVAEQSGKMIDSLSSMFGYTMLLVPFMKIITNYTTTKSLTLEDLSTLGVGVISSAGISLTSKIIQHVLNKLPKNLIK